MGFPQKVLVRGDKNIFSYYGSKSKIVHLYPKPKHGLIIEPFAGSARYALRYFDREVILIDKYQAVIDVWHYLQSASEKDILNLPRFKQGENLNDFNLSREEKLFCGFLVGKGRATPGNVATKFTTSLQPTWIPYQLKRTARELFKIRHWQIKQGDYTDAPNVEATWFIDPPYSSGGECYFMSSRNIDFPDLAKWSLSRNGQKIVCENSSSRWMEFQNLTRLQGTRKATTEVFWTNEQVEYQATLF